MGRGFRKLLLVLIGDVVMAGIAQFREDLEAGALVSIDMQRLKVRILPIRKN
jgi:hypothetical protein